MRKIGFFLLLVGAITAVILVPWGQLRKLQQQVPITPDPDMHKATPDAIVGYKAAQVGVVAFIPKQADSYKLLKQAFNLLGPDEKSRVQVAFFFTGRYGVQVEMQKRGLSQPTILINNRSEWSVKENGQERQISLIGVPGSAYETGEVIKVVDWVLLQYYGRGFSPSLRRKLLLCTQGPPKNDKPSTSEPFPSPRIKVEVFLPSPNSPAYHFLQPTLEAIAKWKGRFPQQVEVTSSSRYDPEVQKSLQDRGLATACVLLKLEGPKKIRPVVLEKEVGKPILTFTVNDLEGFFQQHLGEHAPPRKANRPSLP